MKVLHVLKTNSFSGAENIAITICRNMKKDCCAYASPKGAIVKQLEENNIIYYSMNKFSIGELKKVLLEFQPDIVHAHDFTASVYLSFLCKKQILISHLHNNAPWIRNWNLKSIVYKKSLKRIDCVLLVSEAIKKEAIFSPFFKRCIVIGNPIDKDTIEKKANEKSVGGFDILFVGRLTEAKDPITFIEIIGKLVETMPSLSAVMLGDGELLETCRHKICQLHLEKNICMKGFCENPYPYMKEAKLMIVTSKWEGFGLVAREGLALKTPVLINDVGGMHELVNEYPEIVCNTMNDYLVKSKEILQGNSLYIEKFNRIFKEQEERDDLDTYMSYIRDAYGAVRHKNV